MTMRPALLIDHAWIDGTADTGILVCLRTGKIVATFRRNAAGWLARTFVSPLSLLEQWWAAGARRRNASLEIGWKGCAIVTKGIDRNCVQQDAELWVSVR